MVLVTEDKTILKAYIKKVSGHLFVYISLFCVFSAIHPYLISFMSCVIVGLSTIYLMSLDCIPVSEKCRDRCRILKSESIVFLVDTTKAIITAIVVFSIIGLVLYFYPFPLIRDNDRLLPYFALY